MCRANCDVLICLILSGYWHASTVVRSTTPDTAHVPGPRPSSSLDSSYNKCNVVHYTMMYPVLYS